LFDTAHALRHSKNKKAPRSAGKMPVAQDAIVRRHAIVGLPLKSGESPPLGSHLQCSIKRARLQMSGAQEINRLLNIDILPFWYFAYAKW
jgi:hypothetical protein